MACTTLPPNGDFQGDIHQLREQHGDTLWWSTATAANNKAAKTVLTVMTMIFVLGCCSQVKIISQYLEIKGCKVHHLEQKAKTQHRIEQIRSIAVGQPHVMLLCTYGRRDQVLPQTAAQHSPPQSLHSPGKRVKYPPQHHSFQIAVNAQGVQFTCLSTHVSVDIQVLLCWT